MAILQIDEITRFFAVQIRQKRLGKVIFIIYKLASLKMYDRDLAQLVERHPYKVDVIGSSPVVPTNFSVQIIVIKIIFKFEYT